VLNWSGDESATVAEILERVAAANAATAEHEAGQRECQAARDEWLAGREAARRQAFTAALARQPKPHGPQAHAEAREAAHEARLEFERRNPLPAGLNPAILGDKDRGLLRRAAEKVGIAA
jgi:hypothetical protein